MSDHLHQYPSWPKAQKAYYLQVTPRFLRMADDLAWHEGTQYHGLPSWFDDSVPRWDRGACIVYPIVKIACASNVDLVFGGDRFPTLTAGSEDEDDEEGGLEADDSASVDRFYRQYHKRSRFASHCREVYEAAQSAGTAVSVHGVRDGRPFNDLIPAHWCTPELGPNGEVLSLEVRYPYYDEFRLPDGKWDVRCMVFRRVIDAQSDTYFLPAAAPEEGGAPSFQTDPANTVRHGLGFCPVVWYPFMKGCAAVNKVDGSPIHHHLKGLIRQHDVAVSSRHICTLLTEPQICEIGVEPGYNPTDAGSAPTTVLSTANGGVPSPSNPVVGRFSEQGGPKTKRKRGPGYVWQYGTGVTVEVLSVPADVVEAQDLNASDLRRKLQESLAVVLIDPENMKAVNNVSGKALEALREKQTDRTSQHRDDLEDGFLIPAMCMQARIALKASPDVPGLEKVRALLEREPEMRCVWPGYSRRSPQDDLAIMQTVQLAVGGTAKDPVKLLPKAVAVQKIADIFGVENVEAVLESLAEEDEEDEEEAQSEREDADREADRQAALRPPPPPGQPPAPPAPPQ